MQWYVSCLELDNHSTLAFLFLAFLVHNCLPSCMTCLNSMAFRSSKNARMWTLVGAPASTALGSHACLWVSQMFPGQAP